MSTNRIKTPKAFVDLISFNMAHGWTDLDDITTIQDDDSPAVTFDGGSEASMFDMRPSNSAQIAHTTQAFYIQYDTGFSTDALGESSFLAILNHNFDSADVVFKVEISDETAFDSTDGNYGNLVTETGDHTKVINANADSATGYIDPSYNGWTLITCANNNTS